jgi:hypothetical protein
MTKVVEIRVSRDRLEGAITFEENPAHLHAQRTAAGFKLSIPIKIGFYSVLDGEPMPMLSNLRGTVLVINSLNGSKLEVGRVYNDSWFTGYRRREEDPRSLREREDSLTWEGSLTELAVFEKFRDGRVPQLEIDLRGEFCFLLSRVHQYLGVRTEPQQFYSSNAQITYPREVWIKMLRGLGVAENVLVEVPLPGVPSADWDPVWKGLIDARNYFEQGGETGWKGCVSSVRLALEKWQKKEAEDPGPGFVKPSVADRESRTKKQRLDQLRWDLLQMAHQGPHTHTDLWTRDDALLMLSTLSALLAERKA